MNKRGLSQVVTTVLLIVLILVAVSLVWFAVNRFISKGTGGLNTEDFTLDLKIKSARVDAQNETATIRVVRNRGEGNLTGIKFIIEDPFSSEVFDVSVTNFLELAERTFELDLSTRDNLLIGEITKISIAPLYVVGSTGLIRIGGVTDSSSGNLVEGEQNETEITPPDPVCDEDLDCGSDYWINDSEVCSVDSDYVLQYKKVFSCVEGFCASENQALIKETCQSGESCFEGVCTSEPLPCNELTVGEDCGVNGFVGVLRCSLTQTAVVQDYRTYSCVNSSCQSSTEVNLIDECGGEEICFDGECFVPVGCSSSSDCDIGDICINGNCEPEVVVNSGTIRSSWPFGIGEYFDSFDLPLNEEDVKIGYYVIFPGSLEERCLKIQDFVVPTFPSGISYIRLNEPETNITDTDNYEIWQTSYICSTL